MILSHILLWWTTCLLHLLPTCTFQLPILPLECHNSPSLCLLPIFNCEFPCLPTYKILDKFFPHRNISADTQVSISMRPSCQLFLTQLSWSVCCPCHEDILLYILQVFFTILILVWKLTSDEFVYAEAGIPLILWGHPSDLSIFRKNKHYSIKLQWYPLFHTPECFVCSGKRFSETWMSTSLFLNYVYTCFPKLPRALFNRLTRNVKRTLLLIFWLFDVCGAV